MSTRRLVVWITFLAVFAMAARVSVDTDTWWHLRAGEWMIEHRRILQADPFSYTRGGAAWRYPGWLVQIPLALVYRGLGPGGLNLWVAGMVTLAFWFVYRTMEGGVFTKAFVMVLAAAAAGVYWAARPYMVTFVLTAVFLWILEDFRKGKRDRLWWLPVLMVLWANSHGGFAAGFLLWGVYLVGAGVLWVRDRRRVVSAIEPSKIEDRTSKISRLIVVGALLVAAVALNPSGPAMLLYPFKTVSIGALRDFIQEWQSPNFHEARVQPFAWMLLLTLGAVGASRKGLRLEEFLLVAGFGYMGLLAARNVALFALVAAPVLSRHASAVLDRAAQTLGVRPPRLGRVRSRLQGWVNRALLGVLLLAVGVKMALVFPPAENENAFRQFLPLEAVAFLQETRPPGRLFNSYNWGAYLLWALPEYPVFVDGRTDLYNDEIIDQWFQVARAEAGWEQVLARWEVNLVLIEANAPLARVLEAENWRLLYADEMAVVYGRE